VEDPVEAQHDHPQDKFHVRVLAPTVHQPREFAFPRDEVVGSAAAEAATAFDLHPTSPSFERQGGVLDRSLTLEAAGVHDGDELELVDVGGGV
jgi:hypothetical protein